MSAALNQVRANAPLPDPIIPSGYAFQHGYKNRFMPGGCQPTFGPGVTARICHLADSHSPRVVTVIGDSHAGTWMPAIIAAGRILGVTVVPLDKPGCLLTALHRNRPGWPCARWYDWALAHDHKLHPAATLVLFQLTPSMQTTARTTTDELSAVLGQVTHGVLLTDPPGQTQQPVTCITQRGATMRQCSSRVPSTYVPLMHAIAQMSGQTDHPALPTLQWFCAYGICPMVIDHMLTLHDLSHMNTPYSTYLGPLLSLELKPILAKLGAG